MLLVGRAQSYMTTCSFNSNILNVYFVFTHSRQRGVRRSVASVCLFVCALKEKRLELLAFSTKVGRTSACTDPEVKGQRSNPNPNPRELKFARRGSACRYDCI